MAFKQRYDRKEGRLIPRRKHGKPFRFVGIGILVTAVIIYLLYRIIVK